MFVLLRFVVVFAFLFCAGISSPVAQEVGTSHAPDPAELIAILNRTDKVVVYSPVMLIGADGSTAGASSAVLYSSENAKDIADLQKAIAVEKPESWFLSACDPYLEIELLQKGKQLGVISLNCDVATIGFSEWNGDARLLDQNKLARWFSDRGVAGPSKELKEMRAKERADRTNEERWIRAMPAALRPLWPGLMRNQELWDSPPKAETEAVKILKPALEKEFPEVKDQIRALFRWFGSGGGPWTGFPVHEDVPARLLLEYKASELIAAVQGNPLSDSEKEGAARFFSSYCYGYDYCPPKESTLLPLLPEGVKKSLLAHVLRSSDSDKVQRARSAFGEGRKPRL